MSEQEEKGYYKITHIVEITAYVWARNERTALAINHQHSHSGWDGQQRTVGEKVERVEETPTDEQLHPKPVEISCPCVKATVIRRGKTETTWIPVEMVEIDGLEKAAEFICGEKIEIIACNRKRYYINQTDELWKPLSEGGEM